jgi:hypothetical protein
MVGRKELGMADEPKSSDSSHPERRLPTKAQIRAAAYGGRQPTPPMVELPPQHTAEAIPLAVPSDPKTDDTWLIAATKADGWDIWLCDQVLRGHEIDSEVVTSGIPAVRVRRKDYSAAIRKLQEEKSKLWSKPTGMANWIVSIVFLGVLGVLAGGGVFYATMMSQGSVLPTETVVFAVLLPVIILALFGVATAFRRR